MANNCIWFIRAVAESEETLVRLLRILRYEDGEFFVYRCFSADMPVRPRVEDGLWCADLVGDCAWSTAKWFSDGEDPSMAREQPGGKAHYSGIAPVCKALSAGIELWAEEPGNGFQQHGVVDARGRVVLYETKSWDGVYPGESVDAAMLAALGVEDEASIRYGFDDYNTFMRPQAIFWGSVGRTRKLQQETPDGNQDKDKMPALPPVE